MSTPAIRTQTQETHNSILKDHTCSQKQEKNIYRITKRTRTLLQTLRINARKNCVQLSHDNNCSLSTTSNAMKEVKQVIDRWVTLIKFERAGYPVRMILLTTEERIRAHPDLISSMNNAYKLREGILCEFICTGIREAFTIIEQAQAQRTHHFLEVIDQERFVP